MFSFKGDKEDIEDASLTFEELRIQKADTYLALDEGKCVSWSVDYCGIRKDIKDPKGTTIASMKKMIEQSPEFLAALKNAKGKNPDCLVKPKVSEKRKGVLPPLKGHFATVDAARNSDKRICLIPSSDGASVRAAENRDWRVCRPQKQGDRLSSGQSWVCPGSAADPHDFDTPDYFLFPAPLWVKRTMKPLP